jgi:hypothetical protein
VVVVAARLFAVPPDLTDGAGVVHGNPERARLVAQLRHGLAADTWIDLDGSETASATATRWRDDGWQQVTILVSPRDQRAAAILVAACSRAGVATATLRTACDGSTDLVPAPPAAADAAARLPADRGRWTGWLSRCPLPLAPPSLAAWPDPPAHPDPLPHDLGLDDAGWRDALLHRVAEVLPAAHAAFRVCLGQHDLGTNPRELAFAGLGLREHNADLLVNILGGA